jgi:hypothetical protein
MHWVKDFVFVFSRWEPIDKLAWLGVPSLLLHIIVLSYDWSSVGREDTVRSALDILSVCAILPRVQVALCENVSFPGEKTKGTLTGDNLRPVRYNTVLRIRDVYPGSRILIFTHPGSRIQKQQQKRGVKKFFVITFYVATNFTQLQIILVLKW